MSKRKSKVPERKFPRIETSLEVPYWKFVKFKMRDDSRIGFVKNLSAGGVFIETEYLFEVGSEIGFEFFVPNSKNAVSGKAVVRWLRNPSVDPVHAYLPAGMGLEFGEFEGDSAEALKKFLNAELAPRRSPGKSKGG